MAKRSTETRAARGSNSKKAKARSPRSTAGSTGRRGAAKTPSPEERHRLIAEEAYLRAERRGFDGGSPEQDWLEAEAAVDARLASPRRRGAAAPKASGRRSSSRARGVS
jgi:hypothetical protein